MTLLKLRKSAKLLGIISIVLILVLCTISLIQLVQTGIHQGISVTNLLPSAVLFILSILIMLTVIVILRDIVKGESPFHARNVSRLKRAAYLLIAYEPVQIVSQLIINRFLPLITEDDGTTYTITSIHPLGGVVLIIGLAALCLAFTFQYGVELQQQSDETL